MMIIILTLSILLIFSLIAIYGIIRSKSTYTSLLPSTTEEVTDQGSEFTASRNHRHNPLLSVSITQTNTHTSNQTHNELQKQLIGDDFENHHLISNADQN